MGGIVNFAKLRALALACEGRFRALAITYERSFRTLFGFVFIIVLALLYPITLDAESWGDTLQFSVFVGVSAGVASYLADKVVS